jgi:hypothetical protein
MAESEMNLSHRQETAFPTSGVSSLSPNRAQALRLVQVALTPLSKLLGNGCEISLKPI